MAQKKTNPTSKIQELINSGLYEVKDADTILRFFIDGERHTQEAICKDPRRCVIAVALREVVPGLEEIEVGPNITKVVIPGICYRYQTPPQLAKALINFDNTGTWNIPDGTYVLRVPTGRNCLYDSWSNEEKNKLKRQAQEYKKRKKEGNSKKIVDINGMFKARALPTRKVSIVKGRKDSHTDNRSNNATTNNETGTT